MDAIRIALLMSALGLAAPALAQQIYRWVDEKGVTHYGQRPEGKGAGAAREVEMKDPTGGAKEPEAGAQGEPRASANRPGETDLQRQEREFQARHARRVDQMERNERARNAQLAKEQNRRRASCEHAQRRLASLSLRYPKERQYYQDIASRNC